MQQHLSTLWFSKFYNLCHGHLVNESTIFFLFLKSSYFNRCIPYITWVTSNWCIKIGIFFNCHWSISDFAAFSTQTYNCLQHGKVYKNCIQTRYRFVKVDRQKTDHKTWEVRSWWLLKLNCPLRCSTQFKSRQVSHNVPSDFLIRLSSYPLVFITHIIGWCIMLQTLNILFPTWATS